MTPLNLPRFDIKLQRDSESRALKVYDRLRGKYVALTPEEWVRQHFVNFLISERAYPPPYMANEVGLKLNGMTRRCDTVVYDRHCEPLVIVEYKAPSVEITQNVFDQIVRYNMMLKADCLIVTNGLRHFCCLIDYDSSSYRFVPEIPTYAELLAAQKK